MKRVVILILLAVSVVAQAADVVLGDIRYLTNWTASATDRVAQFGSAPPAVYYACGFNRTNSALVTASAVDLGITNAWTVVALVEMADTGGFDHNLFQFGSGFSPVGPSCAKLVCNTVAGATYFYWSNSGSTAFRYATYNTLGTSLVYIAATWDGSDAKLYSNGVIVTPVSTPITGGGAFANDSRKLFIGVASNNDGATLVDRWQGRIHNLAIWNYALAATALVAIATDKCTVPAGSPNHNYNTFTVGADYNDTVGSVDVPGTNITAATTSLVECP